MAAFTSSLLTSLTESKTPVQLLLDLDGRENRLCKYGTVGLPFLILEGVTIPDIAVMFNTETTVNVMSFFREFFLV